MNDSGRPVTASVLVALHDVSPFHLPRLRRAEALFSELGVERATYLFIPDYHRGNPAADSPEFLAWCRAVRPHAVEWLLHGYYHLQDLGDDGPIGLLDRMRMKLLTGGEGEFFPLSPPDQRHRIARGMTIFETCLGQRPTGFVAPAFLYRPQLLPLLADCGLKYTEDHRHVIRLDPLRRRRSPVLTWATRTWARKHGSILAAPFLLRQWADEHVLRVAVHPFDFDHSETIASIRSVLGRALTNRRQILPADVDFDAT
jgi:uncharacterized protein